MYFDIHSVDDEEYPVVNRISYSSAWRHNLGMASRYFSDQKLPLGLESHARTALSPAEVLFGVVDKKISDDHANSQARSLASRLRFYDAEIWIKD